MMDSQDITPASSDLQSTLPIDVISDNIPESSRQNNGNNRRNRGRNSIGNFRNVGNSSEFSNRTKVIFHHLMPVPGGYGSLFFDGKEVTAFLKSLDRCYKDHGIDDNEEKKERTAEYSTTRVKRDIKRLPEFKDSTTWEDFEKVLLKEYRYGRFWPTYPYSRLPREVC